MKIIFHKDFKLQGFSFNSVEELISFSEKLPLEVTIFLKEWFNKNSFVVVKTSGSTGDPKLIKLQKEHMVNSAKATASYFNLPNKTTALLCMSVNYIAGKMMLVRALTLGWNLDIVEASATPLENISKVYDFCAMVPLQLHSSIDTIEKIKKVIVGGGVVSNELLLKIQPIKTEIFATYGMTETITHIAIKKLNNFKSDVLDTVEKSNYKILPNIKISTDKRGCLVIDAPKVASTKIITNDLVEIIAENEFKWLGRFDSVINSGGIKLIPEQIEDKLSKVIKQRFFVTGIVDAVLGEKLILIIEGVKNKDIIGEIENIKILSKFEKPKNIYFIKKFEETPTQKINRKKTLELLKNIC